MRKGLFSSFGSKKASKSPKDDSSPAPSPRRKPRVSFEETRPEPSPDTEGNNSNVISEEGDDAAGIGSVPSDMVCPLSLQVMVDPVTISSGQTYERAYIENWFSMGNSACPVTKIQVDVTEIRPNAELRARVADWAVKNNRVLPTLVEVREEMESSSTENQQNAEFDEQQQDRIREEMMRRSLSSNAGDFKSPKSHQPNSSTYRPFSETDIPLVAANLVVCDEISEKYDRKKHLPGIRRSPGLRRTSSRTESADKAGPSEAEILAAMEQAGPAQEETVLAAVTSLRNMTRISSSTRLEMFQLGVMEVLLARMLHAQAGVVEQAVTAALNLALEPQLKVRMVAAGALPRLTQLAIHAQTEAARENAIGAICNLSAAEANLERIREVGCLPLLVEVVRESARERARRDALVGLFNLSLDSGMREEMVDMGVVELCVECLQRGAPEMDEQIAQLLYSVAKSPSGCEKIADCDGISTLALTLDCTSSQRTHAHIVGVLLLQAMDSELALSAIREEVPLSVLNRVAERGLTRTKDKVSHLLRLLADHP